MGKMLFQKSEENRNNERQLYETFDVFLPGAMSGKALPNVFCSLYKYLELP
jgi:hypothetical protein